MIDHSQEPRDYDGKLHAQQAALRKLQRKYDTVKGDLRMANERATRAERERDQALDSLREIARVDELVDANEDAFSVHAFRRAQRVARYALGEGDS